MPSMPKPRLHGLYGYSTLKALQDCLYERSIDRAWKVLKEVFGPTEEEAEEYILRAVAEYEKRHMRAAGRRVKAKKRRARRRTVRPRSS